MNQIIGRMLSGLAAVAVAVLLLVAPAAAGEYEDAFPAPLAGWTAGSVAVQSAEETLMGMPVTRRRFLREYHTGDGAAGLAIALDSFDCVGASTIDTLHADEEMQRRAAPQMVPMRFGAYLGVEMFDDSGVRDMVGLKVTNCGIVSVGGPALPDGAIDAYLKQIDFGRFQDLLK